MNTKETDTTDLAARSERILMFHQATIAAGNAARDTADRLYGGASDGEHCSETRIDPHPGSFARMDLCLDALEAAIRETDNQIARLTRV